MSILIWPTTIGPIYEPDCSLSFRTSLLWFLSPFSKASRAGTRISAPVVVVDTAEATSTPKYTTGVKVESDRTERPAIKAIDVRMMGLPVA